MTRSPEPAPAEPAVPAAAAAPAGRGSVALRTVAAVLLMLLVAALHRETGVWLNEHSAFLPLTLALLLVVLWGGPVPTLAAALVALPLGLRFADIQGMAPAAGAFAAATFATAAAGIILLAFRIDHSRRIAFASERRARQQEKNAAEAAEKLNLLIESAQGQAIYMLDPEGRVTIWNKGAERLTGWTESETIGQHILLFYPPEAVAEGAPDTDLHEATQRGRMERETWLRRKDGTEFLASIAVTALRDENGRLRGFAKIVSDITRQRQAEDALRASENHLRSILATVPEAMVAIDGHGTILTFSGTAETLFGYRADEAVGRNVALLMPSPDRERHHGYIRHYLETGEPHVIGIGREVTARRKDGTIFPVELSIGEVDTGEGRLFTGFIRDLSQRRRTEEKLAAVQAELIHVSRVGAMGAMASTLAHELNQPITAVVNYVEGVRDLLARPAPLGNDDRAMVREALDDAAREALRAGNILRHLRDFVARGEVEKTVEPLPALIREAATFGLMGSREKGVETVMDIDPAASPVLVDKVQIEQVLINLIRNAVEAMSDSPERRLTIRTGPEPDQPGYVRVSVADTGPGVPPAVADQLFNAFVSTKTRGMGLGLSICRTIIEANGGHIGMELQEGGGSLFHFTLARAPKEEVGHDD